MTKIELESAQNILHAHTIGIDKALKECGIPIEDISFEDYLSIGIEGMLVAIEKIAARSPEIKEKAKEIIKRRIGREEQ